MDKVALLELLQEVFDEYDDDPSVEDIADAVYAWFLDIEGLDNGENTDDGDSWVST